MFLSVVKVACSDNVKNPVNGTWVTASRHLHDISGLVQACVWAQPHRPQQRRVSAWQGLGRNVSV